MVCWGIVKYSTVGYCTLQYRILYITIQYLPNMNTLKFLKKEDKAGRDDLVCCGIVQYSIVGYCTVQYRILYITIQYLPWGQDDQQITWSKSSRLRNKIIKSSNGNGKEKINNLKIINWNLGPILWVNKVDDIFHMVTDLVPDVAIISEANIYSTDDSYRVNIQGYNMTTTCDYTTNGFGRLIVLTKQDLKFQVMKERMKDNISTIWLKFARPGRKPFLLGAIYREHKLLDNTCI